MFDRGLCPLRVRQSVGAGNLQDFPSQPHWQHGYGFGRNGALFQVRVAVQSPSGADGTRQMIVDVGLAPKSSRYCQ